MYLCNEMRNVIEVPISMELKIIAHARNGFSQKFGIPRQSREDSCIETHIVFTPTYRVREALRGIEEYSHLWLLWGFSEVLDRQTNSTSDTDAVFSSTNLSWSPTVRPPRLGGNKRMGVFATRSPFRPNPIGLTSVRLLRLEESKDEGLILVVAGADLLDGTPIYDIKPYLTFSDSHPQACCGFADTKQDYHLIVDIDNGLLQRLQADGCPWAALKEILSQDPRPAYQNDPDRVYHLEYAGWDVEFKVNETKLQVEKVSRSRNITRKK